MRLAEIGETVWDERGRPYVLGEEVARGGEGVVYREGEGSFAIKMIHARTATEAQERRRRCAWVMRQETPPSACLVPPIALLDAPHLGYVMPLVKGHEPFGRLLRPDDDFPRWFNETMGGLRRRFLLLARVAGAFRSLHLSGLSYCDVSDANILVSRKIASTSVCLVDPDNLSTTGEARSLVLGTPWYIAPEILRGLAQPDAITDAHSLAVLVFRTLRLGHPLLGDAVRAASPDVEAEALRGHRPFVDHPDDESNRHSTLLSDVVITPRLRELFERAFVAGLTLRLKRPTEMEWQEALLQAADVCTDCTHCARSFLPTKDPEEGTRCPWCERAQPLPAALLLYDVVRDPTSGGHRNRKAGNWVLRGGENKVWSRHTKPIMPLDDAPTGIVVRMGPARRTIVVANEGCPDLWWSKDDPSKPTRIAVGASAELQDKDFVVFASTRTSPVVRMARFRAERVS